MLCFKHFPKWINVKRRWLSKNDSFHASDGWLDGWKTSYAISERHIVGETGDVAEQTITSWMERIVELTEGYKLEDIWNMGETGCFFKALPEKGLVEKGKKAKSPNND